MGEISELLKGIDFRFDKRLGQNFLTDTNLLRAIVSDAGVTEQDTVLEIGAGAGTLTRELAARAGRVIAYEIDERLRPVLERTLEGVTNAELRFGDFMDEDMSVFLGERSLKVCANLPYLITTPALMKLIESGADISSVTLMVQREVAERLTASPGTSEYGSVTVAAAASLTSLTRTLAPSRASIRAWERPSPPPAPVTIAIRPPSIMAVPSALFSIPFTH